MQHVQPPTDAIRVSARSVGLGRLEWSEDRVNELAALLKGGLSYGLAAEKLGVTRNSTLGLAHRRREAGDARFALHRAPVRTKPIGAGAEVRKRKAAATPTPRPAPDAMRLRGLPLFCSSARSEIRLPVEPLGLSIVEVGRAQCRHMGGGFDSFRCCGAPTDGGPWCPAHRTMLYAGTQRERRR